MIGSIKLMGSKLELSSDLAQSFYWTMTKIALAYVIQLFLFSFSNVGTINTFLINIYRLNAHNSVVI